VGLQIIMKRKEYITLTLSNGANQIHLNSMMICSIADLDDSTKVTTMDGGVNFVKESSEEILNMIDSSQNINIINKSS
jgi:uncharacterized protein YlzI (FlbEa/FlbD family)